MAKKLRVIFMGTPEFSVPALDKIYSRHEIVAVYTQPDKPIGRGLEMKPTPVKKRAIELGLSVHQPEKLSLPGEYEKLQALNADVMVVVAYGQLLKQNVLDIPRLGCVNIHSSLLPRWRGAAPIHHAILSGDLKTGVTTMKMVLKLDAGDIYEQNEVLIGERETVGELHDRLSVIGGDLILSTLEGLEQGTLKGRVQDESKVTYASKLTKDMENLDPSLPASTLDRQVRALNPWPGSSIGIQIGEKTERLKVRQSLSHPKLSLRQGELTNHAGMLVLGTSQGALELKKVQSDGKKEMDAASFLNGLRGRGIALPLQVGSRG